MGSARSIDHLARNPSPVDGCKERNDVGNVRGLPNAPQCRYFRCIPLPFRSIQPGCVHIRIDDTGKNRIDCDASWSKLLCQLKGERIDCSFRQVISHQFRHSNFSHSRGYVNDPSLITQTRQRFLYEKKRGFDVNGKYFVKRFFRCFFKIFLKCRCRHC